MSNSIDVFGTRLSVHHNALKGSVSICCDYVARKLEMVATIGKSFNPIRFFRFCAFWVALLVFSVHYCIILTDHVAKRIEQKRSAFLLLLIVLETLESVWALTGRVRSKIGPWVTVCSPSVRG
jgi:hypothetical protein